jgi:outer membrane protein W
LALRRSAAALAAALALGVAPAAAAPEGSPSSMSPRDRPHTVAVVEAGIIALPAAPISAAFQGGKTPFGPVGKGDATLLTGLHLLYRANRDWSFGAVGVFAPNPTSDTTTVNGLRRTHSRNYLFLGGEVRYYPFRLRWLEAWVGVTAGGVIIADRFSTDAPPVPAFLGTTTVTVSTEGFGAGLQVGADYLITDQWVLGLALRADQWILPTNNQKPFTQDSSCDTLGDCPTLTGGVQAFEFGITLGYQLAL